MSQLKNNVNIGRNNEYLSDNEYHGVTPLNTWYLNGILYCKWGVNLSEEINLIWRTVQELPKMDNQGQKLMMWVETKKIGSVSKV